MKKWFGLLSTLILSFGICNVTLGATKLKDVEGTIYEDAVQNLVEVGLVNGYEDDTYRPEVTVTRAQMAKMMVIALGEEGKVSRANEEATTFTDMTKDHWAYGYINVAKNLYIINGYTDGSFGPDETVTYAEATTMVLRALGYDEEVQKSSEAWPNNYTSYAKKLSLYDSIGSFAAGRGASRGDTAILLWNMMKTGVCTAKQYTANGGIIYGPGQRMINKYKNYIYMEDAVITDVDFDDNFENANVTITGDDKLKLSMSDSDVLDFYGRNLTILYNTKNKSIISIDDSKKYTENYGSVTNVTSKKIYIDDENYTLPSKENILLYRVESLSDAIEATVFRTGSTVNYILASGAKDVYIGLVAENNLEVDDEKGIKLKKLGSSSSTSYALIDSDDMPIKGSILIYYLNSDNELGVLKEIDVDDAKSISSVTSTKIKIGSTTYTYNTSNFTVVTVGSSKVSNLTFKNIDATKDLAYVYEYAGKTYVVVYEDSVEDEETKAKALADLKEYIKDYEYLENRESSYSQSTFVPFIEALTNARSMTSSSKLVKINSALDDLKTARTNLKTVTSTSTEGKIASYRAKIRTLLKTAETIIKNKAQYTEDSYANFYAEYTVAKKLLNETTNTENEAKNAYEDLNSAMSSSKLKKIVDTDEHKAALTKLNTALTTYGKTGPESDYTTTSYATYQKAKTAAENAKTNYISKTALELITVADNLESAFKGLDLAIDTLKDELNELIVESIEFKDASDDYMPETFKKFDDAFDNAMIVRENTDLAKVKSAIETLKVAKDGLKLINDVLSDTKKEVEKIKSAPKVADALAMPEKTSEDKLYKIENINAAAQNDLETLINKAKVEISNVNDDALVNLLNATSEAQIALDKTLKDIVDAYVKLNALVSK